MTEFPNDSECLLREDSKSVGTGKTHGLFGGRVLRKCSSVVEAVHWLFSVPGASSTTVLPFVAICKSVSF